MKKTVREVALYVIGAIVFAGFFWSVLRLMGQEVPAANRDSLMLLLGVLSAKFGTVVDYFFGSSKGSADKSEALTTKTEG